MKFRLVGDHSDYHCGSRAVAEFLLAELAAAGAVVDDATYDILVVNGEGSMHHDSRTCRAKLQQIGEALQSGRRAWLVNTVWQSNRREHDALLRGIERIAVRETLSQRELRFRHGVRAEFFLDFSYFAAIDESADAPDFGGRRVVTDFYSRALKNFARLTTSPLASLPYVDMGAIGWSALVRGLRTTPLLVTGRHHAVYAACRARTPFVAAAGNTFKIEGLLDAAGSRIPVARNWAELQHAIDWAGRNRAAYDALFDWMEAQPRWSARRWLEPGGAVPATGPDFRGYWRWLARRLRRD